MSCEHLRKFRAEGGGAKTMQLIQRYAEAAGNGRAPPPRCATCGVFTGRLFSCLHCVHFACAKHLRTHQKSHAHILALELTTLHVFCAECGTFVYNSEWESIARSAKRRKKIGGEGEEDFCAEEADGGGDDDSDDSESDEADCEKDPQQQHQSSGPFSPGGVASAALPTSDDILRAYATAVAPHGVRLPVCGLHNLGNSCFMNSVLQCVVHNPLIRNWFLSDMHWRCPMHVQQLRSTHIRIFGTEAQKQQLFLQQAQQQPCLACELATIIQETFSGGRLPVAPSRFLTAVWRIAGSFASYEQQDSHEFFITMLNVLHAEITGQHQQQPTPSSLTNDATCTCVVHRTFGGMLRSVVTCSKCGNASKTEDPFLDVSLDVPRHQDTQDGELCTLASCISRYTRSETLAQSERFLCSKCNERCDSVKQLSFAKLPNVICFHLKRFEHVHTRHLFSKIETRVDFPCTIDLSAFTSGNRDPGRTDSSSRSSSTSGIFELFGVVSHTGRVDAGHYTSFVRSNKAWYFCDDADVTRTTVSQVLKSQAYMLFYVKKRLEYEGPAIFSPNPERRRQDAATPKPDPPKMVL